MTELEIRHSVCMKRRSAMVLQNWHRWKMSKDLLDKSLDDIIKSKQASRDNRSSSSHRRGRGSGGRKSDRDHAGKSSKEVIPRIIINNDRAGRRGRGGSGRGGRKFGGRHDDRRASGSEDDGDVRRNGSSPNGSGAGRPGSLFSGVKVRLSNLNWEIDSDDLAEVFKEVEGLKKAEVKYDKSGRSEGYAVLMFSKTSQAERFADEYDGVNLDDKAMKVELLGSDSRRGSASHRDSDDGEANGDGGRVVRINQRKSPKESLFGSRLDRGADRKRKGSEIAAEEDYESEADSQDSHRKRPRKERDGDSSRGRSGRGGGRGGRGRGRGQGRQERKPREKEQSMTAEQLDADLENYLNSGPSTTSAADS